MSPKYTLDRSDLLKIARGAALAAAGAVVAYLSTEVLPHLDPGTALGGAIAAVAATALNAVRKWLSGPRAV